MSRETAAAIVKAFAQEKRRTTDSLAAAVGGTRSNMLEWLYYLESEGIVVRDGFGPSRRGQRPHIWKWNLS